MKKLLLLLLLFPYFASAGVVTGQAQPTQLQSSNTSEAQYDFDNNGQFDIYMKIVNVGGSDYALLIKGLNGAKIETDGNLNVLGYNAGTPLGVNASQDSGYIKSLNFPLNVIKYAGFKFKIGSNFNCGYLAVSAHSYEIQASFSFYNNNPWDDNFGYETNSAICITTAAPPTAINEINPSETHLTITNNTLAITNKTIMKSMKLYSAAGALALSKEINSTTLDQSTSGLAPGIYLLMIGDVNEKYWQKKVFVP